ncbi:uncharacterized protein V1510DRAFT_442897 [Dipodascopsis tothii]|uniref:uncharacterized protein n=1 Tax=Dipodascopsis tothii TaxID=44089 RepID=UPI0034CEDE4A
MSQDNMHIDEMFSDDDSTVPTNNARPATNRPVYFQTRTSHKLALKAMRWGFEPFWANDRGQSKTTGRALINTRTDSLSSKMWNSAFRTRRCLVPVEGYYEWRYEGGKKVAYYVRPADGSLLYLAGLYSSTHTSQGESYTFSILTTEAPPSLKYLHERMPLVIEPGIQATKWLDPTVVLDFPQTRLVNSDEWVRTAIKCTPYEYFLDGPREGELLTAEPKNSLANFFGKRTADGELKSEAGAQAKTEAKTVIKAEDDAERDEGKSKGVKADELEPKIVVKDEPGTPVKLEEPRTPKRVRTAPSVKSPVTKTPEKQSSITSFFQTPPKK